MAEFPFCHSKDARDGGVTSCTWLLTKWLHSRGQKQTELHATPPSPFPIYRATQYRKSPKSDHSTKLRPQLNFFLKWLGKQYFHWTSLSNVIQLLKNGAAWLSMVRRGSVYGATWLSMVRRRSVWCGVAQLVARRLAVRQARVRFSARHHRDVFPTELSSDEEIERNLGEWRRINVYCIVWMWLNECMYSTHVIKYEK